MREFGVRPSQVALRWRHEALARHLLAVHDSVGPQGTPLRYLQFLRAFAATFETPGDGHIVGE